MTDTQSKRSFRGRVLGEAFGVVRPVLVFAVAIGVMAVAMAIQGWHIPSLAMGGVLVLLAAVLVFQVHRSASALEARARNVASAARKAEEHYVDVLMRIVRCTEVHEGYQAGRSDRIGKLCSEIAGKLGLDGPLCDLMGIAGQLHDIGLIAVPEAVLRKATTLSNEELSSVRRHSEVSFDVLQPLEMLAPVLEGIRHHHERPNGTGYPSGLAGEDVPLEARIMSVAEAYESLTHDRPYRRALTPLEAMRELQRCTPDGFDEACVAALAKITNLDALEQAAAAAATGTRPPFRHRTEPAEQPSTDE